MEKASAAVIAVHGRGGSPAGILELAPEVALPGVAWWAPAAAGGSWYPHPFLAPLEANQPGLDSGLEVVAGLVDRLEELKLPSRRVVVCGFSQGACLVLESVARRPRRLGGVAGLTGGLIGPPGTSRDYPGSLDGTPVLLGSGDPDPHVPWDRVEETAEVLAAMGAEVELRRYPGRPHTVGSDEVLRLRRLVEAVAAVPRAATSG